MQSGGNPAPRPVEKWRIVAFATTLVALTAATVGLLIAAPWPISDFIRWQAAHNNGRYYPKLTGGLIFISLGIIFLLLAVGFNALRRAFSKSAG
ncbi:MAG: hypothetical protein J0L53_01355 [Spirochaetes bacterium]|nr:hypothetical protein [Spirochaetota bacterium]